MMAINRTSFVSLNDADLVARSMTGDIAAFREIATRYYPLIQSLARSATHSPAATENVARETFMSAWKQLNDSRKPANVRLWLCGVAREVINKALAAQFVNHYSYENHHIPVKGAARAA